MAKGKLTPKKDAFCIEYIKDRNKTAAVIRAGYAKAAARQTAERLIREQAVIDRIRQLTEEARERAMITVEDIAHRYLMIATANVNEIMSLEIGPCRHCYGVKHKYQWRTPAELEEALQAWRLLPERKQIMTKEPNAEGGFGYRGKGDPCATCHRCDGRGANFTVLRDTTKLSVNAAALYAGVKETQHGIEIKIHDQMHALDQLARFLGVFDDERKPGDNISEAFLTFLQDIGRKGSPPAFGDKRFESEKTE